MVCGMGDVVRLDLGPRHAAVLDRSIGAAIRSRRLELGLTRQILAEAVGVTVLKLRDYEAGTARPSAETLVKIACALGVRPSALFKSAANENRSDA